MNKNGTMDLTQGRPIKQILLFSLPLVGGTLFQQLYSFVDTIMVGRLIGQDALAAVGATYSLSFLIIGFVQGACVGFGIPLAKSFGAKDQKEFQRFYWNGWWICIITAVVLVIGTALLTNPLLRLINTPEDIFADASAYIGVIFLGIPATVIYNFSASALRAAGDSQHPFYFLLFSSFLNIALDYVFIVPIPMGVAGAALATVLSQLVSGLLNLFWLACKTPLLKHSSDTKAVSVAHIKELSIVGFPMGFEYSVSAIGAVIMQGAINALGSIAVAGQTAGEKIRQMFTLPMESVGMGMATYVGQNDGAKRPDRIKSGIKAGLIIQWSYCIFAWVVIFFGKQPFTTLVLGPDSGATGELSIQYLGIMSCLFFIHGALMIMRNTLQGMGYSTHAVLSGVGELLGRALGGFLAMNWLGFVGICIANPLAWGFALIYCSVLVFIFLRRRLQAY
ncbi:MAG: MATE family efflux transporter [Roseburia sp.]|nr:MATE family efflux transporter [Roseburia sp.]